MYTFCDFTQLVRQSTRGIHRLDLVLTTKPDAFISVATQPPIGNSNHDTVRCCQRTVYITLWDRTTYNFFDADYNRLGGTLSCIKWSAFFIECKGVDQCWETFHAFMTKLIDKFVPKLHCVCNNKKQMMCKSISKRQKVKKTAWLKWRANPSTQISKSSINRQKR